MTETLPAPVRGASRGARARHDDRRRPWHSGWWPTAVCWLVAAQLLVAADVGWWEVVRFTVYAAVVVVLPGTLLWRMAVRGPTRPWILDVALGGAVGYAVELASYLPARALGAPLGYLVVPAAIVLVSVAVPSLRASAWARTERAPWWWSWTAAAAIALTVAYCARVLWFPRPLSGDAPRAPYVDQPYHLALVGELRHHVPAEVPFVSGEPLYYHWFLHADVAASSWATGIDPVVLLQRLSMLPMIALTLLGAAAVVWAVTRSWGGSLLAPVLLALAAGPVLPPSLSEFYSTAVLYLSPTTTFAQMLLPALAFVVVKVLRDGVRASGAIWLPLVLLLAASAGSKGSTLPVVGVALVATTMLTMRRPRVARAAALVLGLTVVSVLAAQTWVYGRESQGLGLAPFGVGRFMAVRLGLAPVETDVATSTAVQLTVLFVVGWALPVLAGLVLLGRRSWSDPGALFVVMSTGAGIGGVVVLSAGGNELYFLRVVPVLAAVAAAWGVHQMASPRRRGPVMVVSGLVAGAIVGGVATTSFQAAHPDGTTERAIWSAWGWLVLVTLVVAVLVSVVVVRGRGIALVVVVVLMGTGTGALPVALARWAVPGADRPVTEVVRENTQIGPGGIDAARWLRDHSSPDDLVATNQHCMLAATPGADCDNRSFWIAGYAERRVLLEGWAYTARSGARAADLGEWACCIPFWDPALLAENDAAFDDPDRADIERLRDDHGVRWLFVSTVHDDRWRPLLRLADERYRSGDYVVLEVR